MEMSSGQLEWMGLNKEKDLRKLHINLGVPNPQLVTEAMATCEISKGELSSGQRKGSRTELSKEHQHLG